MTALLSVRPTARAGSAPETPHWRAGLAHLAVLAVLAGACVLASTGALTRSATVTIRAERAGTLLARGADVTLRGVRIGTVSAVATDGSGADITLALDPAQLPRIPADVRARLVPRSLGGERYVELVPPEGTARAAIRDGAVIGRDRSVAAIEAERVLDELLPLLRSVDPAKLAVTLNALATALDGRGDRIGATLATLGTVLARLNAELPQASGALADLDTVSRTYAGAAPQLAATLHHLGNLSAAAYRQRTQIAAFLAAVTPAAARGAGLLSVQGARVVQLAQTSAPVLAALAGYAPEYGCLLRGLADLRPRLDDAFAGRKLRITLELADTRAPYPAGHPRPENPGPDCHGLPSPSAGGGGGDPVVAAALAPVLGRPADQVPDVATLLFGP
ncbi:MAG: phospholipid/cholesterol/gamma-HCH transport system substrate-binding protein, partial [Cryptosporangiaceae bacterium]|nr:phospholipid/cholesterol/gamma-HCH transport system substrate-binding protein [Cryptosporangiaceae bacterium]